MAGCGMRDEIILSGPGYAVFNTVGMRNVLISMAGKRITNKLVPRVFSCQVGGGRRAIH